MTSALDDHRRDQPAIMSVGCPACGVTAGRKCRGLSSSAHEERRAIYRAVLKANHVRRTHR